MASALAIGIGVMCWRTGGPKGFQPAERTLSRIHVSALQSEVKSLDPIHASDTNTQFIINNAWDGLVSWSLEEGIKPSLAERWSYSLDGKTVRFWLRPNLKFSDGSALTAADAARHIGRLVKSPGYFQRSYSAIKKVRSLTPIELEVELKERDPDFLNLIAGVPGKIVKQTQLNPADGAGGWVGSGPFEPTPAPYGWRLRRNQHYYGVPPKVEEIRLPVLSLEAALEAAAAGAVDDLVLFDLGERDLRSAGFGSMSTPLWAVWSIGFNSRSPQAASPEARCALRGELRSADFVREVMPKHLTADSLFPSGSVGAGKKGGGWEDAASVPRGGGKQANVVLYVPEEVSNKPGILRFLEERSGARVSPRFLPRSAPFRWMIEHLGKPDMPAFLLSLNAELPTPRFFVESLHSRSSFNLFGLRNPAIDQIIEETRNPGLSTEFLSLRYRDLQSLLDRECIAIPLMQPRHVAWVRSCVDGVRSSPVSEGYFMIRDLENRCGRQI